MLWQWAVLVAMIGTLAQTVTSARASEPVLRIGMVQGMFRDVQPTMVQALSRPFRSLMEKQSGLRGDVAICPDSLTLCQKLADKSLDLGVLHGFEYAWSRATHPDFEPLVVAGPHGGVVQALILVNVDNPAQSLADLTGDCVVIPRGAKAHCLLYLDQLRSRLSQSAPGNCPVTGLTPEEALNAVATGDKQACLIDAATWLGYKGLQPGGAKRLKVLHQSEPFPPSVLVMRRGSLDANTIVKLKTGLLTAHKTPAYRPLMMMWNLKGFDELPTDYSQQLDRCLQIYPAPQNTTVTRFDSMK